MIHKNVQRAFYLYAYSTTTGDGVTGDAANISVYASVDGGAAQQLAVTITEVDATNMPGWYTFNYTPTGDTIALNAKSSTDGVDVVPAGIYTNPGSIPAVEAGQTGGLPVIGSQPLTYLDRSVQSVYDKVDADTALIRSDIVGLDTKLDDLDSDVASIDTKVTTIQVDLAGVKNVTDTFQFNANDEVLAEAGVDEDAIATAVASQISGSTVIVQPVVASILNMATAGGQIVLWQYAKLYASWVLDEDITGHDVRLVIFEQSTKTKVAEASGTEVTISPQSTGCLVTVSADESKVPLPGQYYGYVLRDQTTDTVVAYGEVVVREAPDAD